jgi:D-glycero-alpha-D-manno-heptose-7-phosphate kinase
MIIVQSPLRISLGGGGTDLPSYYEEHEGYVLAAAIKKYVYIGINRPFEEGIFLKYSQHENVKLVSAIVHPIFRSGLELMQLKTPQIEITSIADIPSGTGLGSSGSFTAALLKGLHSYYRKNIQPEDLAKLACHLELDMLGEPVGKQDQYISALGGITNLVFRKDGLVEHSALEISNVTLNSLEENLILFFTGTSRSASKVLSDQNARTQRNDNKMLSNLHEIKRIGLETKAALEKGNLEDFAELMNEHWNLKRNRSTGITNTQVDEMYEFAIKNGALGGKLVGAGGGGFLLFYTSEKERLRSAMQKFSLEEVKIAFDFEGTKVILS